MNMTTHRRRSAARSACLTSAVVPLALGFTLAGCGAADGTVRTASRDSAGVTIVESNGAGTALPWTVTRVARIEGSPSSLFHRVSRHGLAFRDDGALYVLDGGDQVVHLFDATGTYERTIGRPGRGPGEFELA